MVDRPQITQKMIDLYDEYTHLTLDRRGFMDTLTKLAGSGAAAVALAPMRAANSAKAQIIAADDERLAPTTRASRSCQWGIVRLLLLDLSGPVDQG